MAHPYLCGGVFFFLLTKATYKNGSSRDHKDRIKDNHSNPIVTVDLLSALSGSTYSVPTATKDISNYRNCKSEGSINIPFNDTSLGQIYDDCVKNKYSDTLKRMSEFINQHVDLISATWLVKALLDVVENDNEILDEDLLYIKENGIPVTKSDIKSMTDFVLQPFLVGIWHYILTHRTNKNLLGVDTLNAWGTQKPSKPRVYTGDAGARITRNINVKLWEPVLNTTVDTAMPDTSTDSGEDTPHRIIENHVLELGQVMANVFGNYEKALADEIISKRSHARTKDAEVIDDKKPSSAASRDTEAYSPEDTVLLQEFNSDYDDIMRTLISDNYYDSLIDMSLPLKSQELYQSKWQKKADHFQDPILKSYVFSLLGELNQLSRSFLNGSSDPMLIKSMRTKVRNLYVKLHSNTNMSFSPYDTLFDDWDEGEY